jgi:hypothetical protein
VSGTIEELSGEFADRLRGAIDLCRGLGYSPSRFEQMLNSSPSAVSLAKKLVVSAELQDGLKRIAKLGRLELSMESIMLEEKFKPLFPDQVLEAAKWRLEAVRVGG